MAYPKTLAFLPIFMAMVLVSQSWAEQCSRDGQSLWCQWGSGCHSVNNTYAPNIGAECADLIAGCEKDGKLFTGVTSANEGDGKTCNGTQLGGKTGHQGCCKWAETGKCWNIYSSEAGYEQDITYCKGGDNTWMEGTMCADDEAGTCPGGTSSPSGASSSSATVATGPEEGFFITQFDNIVTKFGDYPFAYVYGDPTEVTITNPEAYGGYVVRNEGVGKLREATLVAQASNGAAAIGIKNNTASPFIADCNSGFSYWYKGAAHQFKIETDPATCGGNDGSNSFYQNLVASPNSWQKATISYPLTTSAWDDSKCKGIPFDATKATQMAWELKTPVSGSAGQEVSLMIDDVICLQSDGPNIYSTAPDNCITINSGWDGTTCSTSSSSTTTTNSSSSTNQSSSSGNASPGQYYTYCVFASGQYCIEGPYNECPYGGNLSNSCPWPVTSIKVSKVAKANEVQLIKNGVSLQVTKNATLEVYNLSGKLFRKVNFASGVYSVQLADLPKGLYVAKVQFGAKKEVLYVPIR